MTHTLKDRINAFLIHLGISAVIAAISMFVVFFIWYPAPLHTAVGVTQIFLILLAVDITIGPLITFIIFKKGKKSLTFDLTVIALLQVAALAYGMNTVFEGRPVFVVFSVDRFEVSRAYEIDPKSHDTALKAKNENAKVSWLQPKWVGAVASKDHDRRQKIMFDSVQGGNDWPQLPELFVPLSKVKKQILEKGKTLEMLRKLRKNDPAVQAGLADWKDNDVKWLPLASNAKNMTVIVDATSAEVLKVVDINPWDK
ncbi:MAG: type IV pilin accessory protein [Methylococcaceae bacterium]|nr:type IV pilin accessory protein [Methylococcaceae bacterium]